MKWLNLVAVFGLAMLVVGCEGPKISLEQKLTTVTKSDMLRMEEVMLPSEFNADNFRSLKMGVVIQDIPIQDGVKPIPLPELVKKQIEGEMIKLRRFTIVPLADEEGKLVLMDISDVDPNFKVKEQIKPNEIDLLLTFMAQRTMQEIDLRDDKWCAIYTVDGQVACRDLKTGTAVFSESVKGQSKRSWRTQGGHQADGFNKRDASAVNQALVSAAKRALVIMFNKLGNKYPIGGRIVKCDRYGEQLTLNKGTDDGVGSRGQQFTVVVDDDGQKIALCYAEAQAGQKESVLKPYRWNDTNRTAIDLKKEYLANPRGFIKQYNVYAMGCGLSVPSEWDSDGTKREVNEVIER